ncbi:MAG: Hsp70 family protein, partial [Verrucomicrobiota bacterium]|nr:Hsp70 family protein [Verrucomicrobiota bacterium]
QRIKEEAEKAKIALSSSNTYEINLPFVTADQTGPKHIQMEISRSKMEQLTEHLLDRTKQPVRDCLQEAGVSASEIDELVLVGGMTRMPKVHEVAKELAGKEPHKGVNPDEVVAIGAGIQGGVLQGDVKDVVLLDVTPLTLAIETEGSRSTPMIERNTTIPVKKSQIFSTAADNQPEVTIRVSQGERPIFANNKILGTFNLEGIESAPRGMPQIEVTFDIDSNGILHVTASDKKNGNEKKISIEGSSGLSDDEIEKAKREAEAHSEEDKKRVEEIDEKNKAEHLVYQVEKQLEELGDQAPAELKSNLEAKTEAVREALKAADIEAVRTAVEELEKTMGELMAAVQQAAGAAGMDPAAAAAAAAGAGAGSVPPEDAPEEPREAKGKVVDAEVVDAEK